MYFSVCDECTQILFTDIDQLAEILEKNSVSFDNFTISSWTSLYNNIEKYKMLYQKYLGIEKKSDDLFQKPEISYLNKSIQYIQHKTKGANELAETNVIKTDNMHDITYDFIVHSKSIQEDLTKLFNKINNFSNTNVSLKDALKKAEETQREIIYISDVISSLQDNKIYSLCSNIKKQINIIYAFPPEDPYKNLEDIENIIDDLMDIYFQIANNLERADVLNRNNSEQINILKNKIDYLNNKNNLTTDNVEQVMEKVEVITDILGQLQRVSESLMKFSKSEEINTLENRIKRQMEKSTEIEEIPLKSIEHVQQLENTVNNYSR